MSSVSNKGKRHKRVIRLSVVEQKILESGNAVSDSKNGRFSSAFSGGDDSFSSEAKGKTEQREKIRRVVADRRVTLSKRDLEILAEVPPHYGKI